MEAAARIGWITRGVLYVLVAVLVARIPSTGGGKPADKKGAFATLAESPFGGWLLGAVAAGMLGFAAWRLLSAIRGADEKATKRLSWVGSAVVYIGMFVLAVGVLRGSGDGGNRERVLTARLLELQGGQVIVGVVGIAILAVAANHLRKAIKERFLQYVDEGDVPASLDSTVRVVGVLGCLGRALVWSLVGWFVVQAAVQHDPNEPIGLDESLRRMAAESYGPTVLWCAFAGLIAFGVLCFATAAWPDPEPDG